MKATKTKSIMSRRVKNSLSDNHSGTDYSHSGGERTPVKGQLSLFLAEKKAELASPKLAITSPEGIPDNEAFAIRVDSSASATAAQDVF